MAINNQANTDKQEADKASLWIGLKNNFTDFAGNQFLILAIIVIALGFAVRLWNLMSFRGFAAPETIWMSMAGSLIKSHYAITMKLAASPLYSYYVALLRLLGGSNQLYIRFGLVIVGIIATLLFYLLTNTWFNKQVSLVATLFFATNATLCIFSRVISPVMTVIALEFAIIYLLTIAFRDKNKWLFLIAGLLTAVGVFTDQLFIVSGALVALISLAVIAAKPKLFRMYAIELSMLVAPIIISMATYLYIFRSELISIFTGYIPASFAVFYLNLGKGLLTIFYGSQFSTPYNVAFEPLLDPLVSVTAICGIIYALFHFNKRKHRFMIFWLLSTLLIFSLLRASSIDYLVLCVPILLIFSALSVDYLLTSWVRTFPFDRSARLLMTAVFSIFLFLSVYYNYQKFFVGWVNSGYIAAQFTQTLK